MSAQSIIDVDVKYVCDKIDEYLICEGNGFRNIVNYDLDLKIDYDKLALLLYLKELLLSNCDNDKVLLIINKILK